MKSQDPGLSPRELELMREVAAGRNDREIAEQLHLATDTVKYHLKKVYQKLQVHSRTRAAISLVLLGLVEPPKPLLPERARRSGSERRSTTTAMAGVKGWQTNRSRQN